ncbi:MAG: glycosyltransferase family 4 protein [Verrucomicrobia bacterium]|jgi:glycosyltransferase involved in cell wall biosynthesis|nr:glycosyltransferase family 4 protein [Verrucomicrobiota bacterium]MBT7068457.1 glycosyltransferase family 4 protein [Verrucomicrobiota bacterium]MBT7699137.1 glycosyltransferase family 4 protein [Verrucomicrobiota bacterium]
MRVLFDTYLPFGFAHGGVQVRYEHTVKALTAIGVDASPLAWWHDTVAGDVIHYFGRPTAHYIAYARSKGLRVVFTDLMGALAARPRSVRRMQYLAMRGAQAVLPEMMLNRLAWEAFRRADACMAQTEAEADLMRRFMHAPPGKVHVIPNGVDAEFLAPSEGPREDALVCVAAIRPLKRVVEVGEAAVRAGVPMRFVGKPYAESDAYYLRFKSLVDRHDTLHYDGPVSDRARLAAIYRQARGFVLLSRMESYSIASAEAAACGCPLLLSELPWARSVYGDNATYVRVGGAPSALADSLRTFHAQAPTLGPPPRPSSWTDVARKLLTVYEGVCQG